jgi:hypothetical protein
MHKSLYYFGAHANYSMVIGKFGGLKMAIFQNQVKKRVIIHYSSFDPQIFVIHLYFSFPRSKDLSYNSQFKL